MVFADIVNYKSIVWNERLLNPTQRAPCPQGDFRMIKRQSWCPLRGNLKGGGVKQTEKYNVNRYNAVSAQKSGTGEHAGEASTSKVINGKGSLAGKIIQRGWR